VGRYKRKQGGNRRPELMIAKGLIFNMKRLKKILPALVLLLLFAAFFTLTASAAGDVAGAIQNTWDDAKTQIKTVVNMVVFPAIDLVLAVLFFVKLGGAWFDYRKHGQFEFAAPAILFGALVLMLTAPTYIWSILGM
jgi:hypothetical protein